MSEQLAPIPTEFSPASMAALKRELTVGRKYKLVGRQGNNIPFGTLTTDGATRTVEKVQTNAIAASVPGLDSYSWLYFGKGDKAYFGPSGFALEVVSGGLATRLIYEWDVAA